MACHGATKVSPYQLVYRHEAVLPWKLNLDLRRIMFQDWLTADEYSALMNLEIDFADRNKEFEIRQMVANVGRAI